MDPVSRQNLSFRCVRCSPPRDFEQLKLLIGHYNLIHAPEGQYILRWGSVLKIACMYCKKDMGEKDGKGVTGISHGICRECWAEHFPGVPYPEEEK